MTPVMPCQPDKKVSRRSRGAGVTALLLPLVLRTISCSFEAVAGKVCRVPVISAIELVPIAASGLVIRIWRCPSLKKRASSEIGQRTDVASTRISTATRWRMDWAVMVMDNSC